MDYIIKYHKDMVHLAGDKIKKIDLLMDKKFKVSIIQLMEVAGLRLAEFIVSKVSKEKKIVFFIGSGNNGGDGLVAARYLTSWKFNIDIILIKQRSKQSLLIQHHLTFLEKYNVSTTIFNEKKEISKYDIIIDGLLGSSLKSKPKLSITKAINKINSSKKTIISIDVPSGLNTKSGFLYNSHVRPQYILSFMCAKCGFKKLKDSEIYIANIGININNFL